MVAAETAAVSGLAVGIPHPQSELCRGSPRCDVMDKCGGGPHWQSQLFTLFLIRLLRREGSELFWGEEWDGRPIAGRLPQGVACIDPHGLRREADK